MNNYPLKRGRPNKLKRDLTICGLADGKMDLNDLAKQYKITRNRLAYIIRNNWKNYLKLKNG